MENLLWGLKDSLKTQSAITMPNIFMAMVDTRDIGKSAAACLAVNGEGHHAKYYEMNGPEMLGGNDLAKVLTKVLGKPIKYNQVPRDKIRAEMPEGLCVLFFLNIFKLIIYFKKILRRRRNV